jgi:D-sedoheptulose 7-phosphate isomerase
MIFKMEIEKIIKESISVKQKMLENAELIKTIDDIVKAGVKTFKNKGKMLFCGNGGSAADAQHLAAEFTGRFYLDREPLFAEALHVNSSYITAVANDYGFDAVYSRLVKAFGNKGDILFALSTSGNSNNIIEALISAKEIGMTTIGFTGETGGKMKKYCDLIINIPSKNTPRIQESHIMAGHIICELIEKKLFAKK